MGTDADTTLADLRAQVTAFIAARDWQPYQTPKNLSMSIAIEAAELMEHFQWLSQEESRAIASDPQKLADVADEIADVLIYCLSLSHVLAVDLTTAIETKLATSEKRYPTDQFRGHYRPPVRDRSADC